jgi:hypothetical protein
MEVSRSNHRTRRTRWAWAVRGASGVALATAVSAASAADGPRAAGLLPPRVGTPAPATVVARGAADDNPLATTPVTRRGATPTTPPAGTWAAGGNAPASDWLSGVDPNVLPAGGSVSPKSAAPPRLASDARPFVTPPNSARLAPPPMPPAGQPSPLAKGVGALKDFITPDAQPQQQQVDARSPGEPLQGTSASGAPVLAGPPAWRWYGYGSVTPGANPYAPSGQYPRASSNWYSVTRATPGAFPVPVVNPYRSAPGSEPPSYVGTPVPTPQPRPTAALPGPDVFAAPPTPRPFLPPEPTGGTKFGHAPVETSPIVKAPPHAFVVPVPAMTTPPVAAAPPAFSPIPLPPPPMMPAAKVPEPVAMTPPARMPEPVLVAPSAKMPEPVSVAPPAVVPAVKMPEPVAVTPPAEKAPEPGPRVTAVPVPVLPPASAAPAADEIRWQANPERAAPAPAGTWVAPADRSRPGPGPGASIAPRLPIARAQAGDDVPQPADPVLALVEAVCRGRAAGIDVRHTGPRRVTVCFETRTQPAAAALVRDLSARPELAPYEINFCVLVK